MARVRMESELVLKTREDVDLNLKEICESEMAIEAIEADLNQKIQDLKLDAEMRAKPIRDRMDKLSQECKAFVEQNRADIKGKTRALNFGSVGFRLSTKIVLKNVQSVIAALKARGMKNCVIVKESVDKDVLKGYPDEILAAVGASKKVEDTFWFETNREKLQ